MHAGRSRKAAGFRAAAAGGLLVLVLARAGWALTPREAAGRLEVLWDHPKLAGGRIAMLVADCSTGETLYSRGATESLVPASTEKLPVTAAALILLGPDYQFRTAAFAGGPISPDGLIAGPLLVSGTADPTADMDIFSSMVAELGKRGVKGCRDIWVSGAVTGSSGDSPQVSQSRLKEALAGAGFLLQPTVAGTGADPPAHTIPLIEHLSEPLGRTIVSINKRSLNPWADNLWRSLAWFAVGSPGKMPDFLRRLWRERGCSVAGVEFADGSGLSRRNRVTPAFHVGLLRYMYHCSMEWPAFIGSLPVAGRDGTLAGRMTKGPSCGRVWAKTGTMHDMATLSGYASTLEGRLLVFSLLMNNLTCPSDSARYLQDRACDVVVQIEAKGSGVPGGQGVGGGESGGPS